MRNHDRRLRLRQPPTSHSGPFSLCRRRLPKGEYHMGRTICWAMFALLATSGTAFPQRFRNRHVVVHVRPVVPVTRFYGWCPPWLAQPYSPLPFLYPNRATPPPPDDTLPVPSYVFVGSAAASYPQLVFKDGTSYTVADYWRDDDQLRFITVEEGGSKFVPHSVPFT